MDKTDHGQNGPRQDKTAHVKDKTVHVLGEKRTTFQVKTDHAWDIPDQLIYEYIWIKIKLKMFP